MAMADTIRTYDDVVGKVVQRIESFEEHGELGVTGTIIEVGFTDGSEVRFYLTARTELAAELSPARKKPQRMSERNGQKSRAATA